MTVRVVGRLAHGGVGRREGAAGRLGCPEGRGCGRPVVAGRVPAEGTRRRLGERRLSSAAPEPLH